MSELGNAGLRKELAHLRAGCARLTDENRRFREQFGSLSNPQPEIVPPMASAASETASTLTHRSSTDAKVKLFGELFRGRDVSFGANRRRRIRSWPKPRLESVANKTRMHGY